MLRNKLYHVKARNHTPDSLIVDLDLCPSHEIFEGHFPHQSILPGVCTLQICKELLASSVRKHITIAACQSIKYTKLIDPQVTQTLRFSISLGEPTDSQQRISATVTTTTGETASKLTFTIAY